MTKRVLGISWLNGTIKVAVCQGSAIQSSWTCPTRVEHLGEWAPVLRQAIEETGFAGSDVMIVLDHRNLVYHLQDTPPGKPAALKTLLDRKVNQSGYFEEEASWSYHEPYTNKSHQRFLLSLVPRSIVVGLKEICAEEGLSLIGVFSPASLLAHQMKRLHLKPSESALLVADLGGSLCLVAGQGNGNILFARNISDSSSQDQNRAAQEVNRTLLYVQQQFGVSINTLWVFGEALYSTMSTIQIRDGMAVRQSPVEENDYYYSAAAASLSGFLPCNLLSPRELRRRQFRSRVALASLILLLTGGITTSYVDNAVKAREKKEGEFTKKWNALEKVRDRLVYRQQEVILLERSLDSLGSPEDPPITPVFLRYLATVVPPEITLTGLTMSREADVFRIRLEGHALESEAPILPILETFEKELTEGRFRLTITDSTRHRIFGKGNNPTAHRPTQRYVPRGRRAYFISAQLP